MHSKLETMHREHGVCPSHLRCLFRYTTGNGKFLVSEMWSIMSMRNEVESDDRFLGDNSNSSSRHPKQQEIHG